MGKLETVKVKKDNKSGFTIINKSKYETNKDAYELFDEVKKPGRPSKSKDSE